MPIPWTSEQVTSMAPDGASLAAGRKQAGARKWQTLGRSAQMIWGEIKGSGANPYQVCIELAGPAFKCSCPSHKFPCKHALGLAYVYAEEATAMGEGEPPPWVLAWIEGRAERAQKKAERAARAAAPETPEAAAKKASAQQKRADSRREKINSGVDELDRWLRDLIRQGLAAHAAQSYGFWDQIAARMVDAQAPGLARLVRRLGGLRYGSGDDWQSRLLDPIARIHLLLSAWRRIDSLDPPLQAEIDSLVGLPQEKEIVRAREGLRDHWLVLGTWIEEEEGLRFRRLWLRGVTSGRHALLIDFAVHSQTFSAAPPPGSLWGAELAFYPGADPLRALVKEDFGMADGPAGAVGAPLIADALRNYSESLTHNPWIEHYPFTLVSVTPEYVEGRWYLRDADHAWLPVVSGFHRGWEMLAVSGGEPLTLFGEWDGFDFRPLTIFPATETARPLLEAA